MIFFKQALVYYMREQAKKRDIRERDREVQDRLQQMRQEMLMRLVFLCIVHKNIEIKIAENDLDPTSPEYRETARELLQQVAQLEACSLYCKGAVKTQIPVYSNSEIYKKVKESSDHRAVIVSHLVNPDMLSEEEQTFVSVINEILLQEANCL